MNSKNLIIPRKLSGFMELLPSKQIIFDNYLEKIKQVFLNNSFLPLDTPILEYSDVLLAKSGGEVDKEVYRFKKGDNDLCMRYDLTVPLARFVSMEKDNLIFPFKRFQIGKVFRGEKPQKGRFRELYQCDADIVGFDDLPIPADAECIKLIIDIFNAINIQDILIQISNRNILFGYCEDLGYSDIISEILIILDKVGKIGKENAILSLEDLSVKHEDALKLINLTEKKGNFENILNEIKNISNNETFKLGVAQLEELNTYLNAYKLDKTKYILDLSIIRGHNYYTGTVFETIMISHPEFGAICAGGRYDNLTGYFSQQKMPGVGISVGITRLFDLLDKNNLLPPIKPSLNKIEIIPLGETIKDCLILEAYLKANNILCQTNYSNKSFKSKMKDANKSQVPYIIIVGENEVASELYPLKNMTTGEQIILSKEDIVKKINNN